MESLNINPIAMEKLKAIVNFKLDLDAAKKMITTPDDEFSHHFAIINQCNANSKYYGASDSSSQVEFRCEHIIKTTPHQV